MKNVVTIISTLLIIIFVTIKYVGDKRDFFINNNILSDPLVKKALGHMQCTDNSKFKSRGAICTSTFVPQTNEQLAKI